MRLAINAAIIRNREILLVKKQRFWILPGGKPKDGEGDLECLCREISEELSGTQICNIRSYGQFSGSSPHKGDIVVARVYFADIKGKIYGPSSEICDAKFVSRNAKHSISDLTYIIISHLKEDGYL